jgi:SAM-dependent methyltransferase
MSWNNGYMTEVEYVSRFYPEQSPVYLNFACVLNGIEPVPMDKEFTYFELGFGQGVTANIMAAANPQGRFYAADFNPAQVVSARELAAEAQLDNLVLLENSFEELAEGHVELPQFDFITGYGIYSWVSPENRRHIVNFVRRYLKPGGIFYVSYNAMPGWASSLPLQRLVREHGMYPGGVQTQLGKARELVDALAEVQAGYLIQNTDFMLKGRVESIRGDKTGYLAHEYMNQAWEALYHMDVARHLADAKLDFACSVAPIAAFPHLSFTPAQRELLDAIPDNGLRETTKDYIENVTFRRDVFVRGARRMTPRRRLELLSTAGLALIVERQAAQINITLTPGGMIEAWTYAGLLDALEDGPKTFAELAALPDFADTGIEGVAEIAAMLIWLRKAAPYFAGCAENDTGPAQRLNRAIARRAHDGDHHPALAAPLLGNGFAASHVQRFIYGALCDQPEEICVEALADDAWAVVAGQTGSSAPPGMTQADVAAAVEQALIYHAPVWVQLNALGCGDEAPGSEAVEHPVAVPDHMTGAGAFAIGEQARGDEVSLEVEK